MINAMDIDDDFSNRSRAFLQWLNAFGATVSDKIDLVDLRHRGAGRGVVAKSDIETDDELFRIPRDLLLNAKNSIFLEGYGNELNLEGEPWLELILVMMYEDAKSDAPKWKPYFDILPAAGQFDTLMYWDEAQLKELEASAVVHKIGKSSADALFKEKIVPVVQANPSVFGFSSDVDESEVLQAAHRMGSLIMAYAFDIESEREREIDEEGYVSDEEDEDMPKAMVPLADMLNANADENNARLFYEPDALVMKAIKPISAGDEIFNDYGPLPTSDLLRRYGYITDNYRQYDVVEVPSSLIIEIAKEKLRLDTTQIEERASHLSLFEEVLEEGYDISRADPEEDIMDIFSPAFKLLITLLVLPESSLPPTIKPSKLEKLVARNEFPLQWYGFVHAVIEARQAQYPSALDKDAQHLEVYKQRLESGMWLTNQQETRRKCMALAIRVGEQEILHDAIAFLQEKLKTTSTTEKRKADESSNGTASPKKAKR